MESPKVQFNKNSEERRKRRTKFLFVALLLLVIIVAGGVGFLRKPELQVREVTITGTRALDPNNLIEQARRDFSGMYVWVVPKSSVLLFSKSHLKQQLLEQFPSIAALDVVFINKNTIQLMVTEKEPVNSWCASSEKCYFIDETGLIYKPAPIFSDGVYVTFSGSWIEVPQDPIRARFVSGEDFKKLKNIVGTLERFPIVVSEIVLKPDGDIGVRISQIGTYQLGRGSQILFVRDSDPETVIQNLRLLMKDTSFINGLIAKGSELEVIDVRFPAKIYYKFKNGTALSSTSSTSTLP